MIVECDILNSQYNRTFFLYKTSGMFVLHALYVSYVYAVHKKLLATSITIHNQ